MKLKFVRKFYLITNLLVLTPMLITIACGEQTLRDSITRIVPPKNLQTIDKLIFVKKNRAIQIDDQFKKIKTSNDYFVRWSKGKKVVDEGVEKYVPNDAPFVNQKDDLSDLQLKNGDYLWILIQAKKGYLFRREILPKGWKYKEPELIFIYLKKQIVI